MFTLSKNPLARFAAGFVVMTFFVMSVAATPAAYAQDSEEELQDRISELEALIAALQAQLGGGSSVSAPSGVCTYTFVNNLGVGSTGQAVLELQKFLNMDPDTVVATQGAGSAGQETMTYGPLTANAVSRFQVKYAADVLVPLGLSQGTGYWGAASRAKAQMLCDAMTPGTPGDDDDDDDDADDDDDTLSGGEASLGSIDVMGSPDNEDVEEGEEDVAVLGFEIEVEDADAMFERIDVQFEAASTTLEDEPWELLDEVSLWHGDDEIARVDASDEDEWEDVDSDGYELRFTGLDVVVDEDETAEFYVAVSAAGNIDSEDLDQEFTVRIPDDGVRAVDGEGINHYEGDDAQDTTFGFDEEGAGEELDVSLASSNPDEAVIMVDEDDTSDAYELLVFELEAEGNDIEINEIPILMTFGTTDEFDQVVSDAWLEVDGEEFNDFDETPASGTSTTFTLAFDIDGDIVVEEDDTVEVSFVVEFQETDGNYSEGLTVSADVTVDDIDAEGADDLGASQLNGSANGDDFTLMAEGIFADFVSEETDLNEAEDVGEFILVFEVTAFEDDFFVSLTGTRGTTSSAGVAFTIENSSGGVVGTGTTTAVLSSDAEEDGFVEIQEGETEEFELQVFFDAATTGAYRLQLNEINFTTTATTSGAEGYVPSPESEFDTGFENVQA